MNAGFSSDHSEFKSTLYGSKSKIDSNVRPGVHEYAGHAETSTYGLRRIVQIIPIRWPFSAIVQVIDQQISDRLNAISVCNDIIDSAVQFNEQARKKQTQSEELTTFELRSEV